MSNKQLVGPLLVLFVGLLKNSGCALFQCCSPLLARALARSSLTRCCYGNSNFRHDYRFPILLLSMVHWQEQDMTETVEIMPIFPISRVSQKIEAPTKIFIVSLFVWPT